MVCPTCNGRHPEGCPECRGRGRIALHEPPDNLITPDVAALFRMCEWAEKGHLPAPGAVLEQTQSFMDAYGYWLQQRSAYREPPDES